MIKLLMMAMVLVAVSGVATCGQAAGSQSGPRVLVAFFSKTNNTRTIAEMIQAQVGGEMFQIATRKAYPDDYRETTRVARAELDNNERPELATVIAAEDMKNYDVIFLGYPNWWGTIPMALFTFLEQHDLSGKTIVPFCTHEGSALGRSVTDIGRLCPGADVRQGLAVRGGSVGGAGDDVAAWLRREGFIR